MNRTSRAHLTVEAQTHAGMTGKNNEDRYAIGSFVLSPREPTPVLFAVLADGIGGHKGGEVAAELAVNHIMEVVGKSDGHHARQTIEDAIANASNAIAARSSSDENLKGMGSTAGVQSSDSTFRQAMNSRPSRRRRSVRSKRKRCPLYSPSRKRGTRKKGKRDRAGEGISSTQQTSTQQNFNTTNF